MTLRPRKVVHRGSVIAHGFYFPDAPAGREASRLRVVALWRPGCRVAEVRDGLVLLLAEPLRVAAGLAPGTPLVKAGGLLSSAPLAPGELDVWSSDGVVLVRGGIAELEGLTTWAKPAEWLDVTDWGPAQVESLAAPPASPPEAVSPIEAKDLRTEAGIAGRSTEADRAIAELRSRSTSRRSVAEGASASGGFLRAIAEWLVQRNATRAAAPAGRPSTHSPEVSAWQRLTARWNAWVVRFLVHSRLATVIGRRQANYLSRLEALFDAGELEQALREALPLGGPTAPNLRVELGVPTPRTSLALQAGHTPASSTMLLSGDYFGHLRERYRLAARQLELKGQVDHAAFVLAELLYDNEAAVELLEKHGRLRQAAELAEGKQLRPGLVVRQWLLAGDVERCIAIARRTGAFADAVLRLERTHPEQAKQLRLHWADTLAVAGDYAAAVRTVWPVKEGRALAGRWLDLGLQAGGEVEASLLPMKLELSPESEGEVAARARVILLDTSAERAPARVALAGAVLQVETTARGIPEIARACARALMRDEASGVLRGGRSRVLALIDRSADGVLRADVESASLPAADPASTQELVTFRWAAADRGPLRILDSVALPSGRILAALGDAGARLMTPDGRTVKTFDVPAHALAVSDLGHEAMAIAPRGEGACLVTRLDLHRYRAHAFGIVPATEWARTYGDGAWFVLDGPCVSALDVGSERLRALWSVRVESGVCGHLIRTATEVEFLHFAEKAPRLERWTYVLPGQVLRSRAEVPEKLWTTDLDFIELVPGGWCRSEVSRPGIVSLSRGARSAELSGRLLSGPECEGKWVSLVLETSAGHEVVVLDEQLRPRLRLVAEGAPVLSARLRGNRLCVSDDSGRIGHFDVEYGVDLRQLRPT